MPRHPPHQHHQAFRWTGEPHPGRRLSYPLDDTFSWPCVTRGWERHGRKDRQYGPYHTRGRGLARRVARHPKLRISSLKPLKIPANVPEEHLTLASAPATNRSFKTLPLVESSLDKEKVVAHFELPPGPVLEVDPDVEKDTIMEDSPPMPPSAVAETVPSKLSTPTVSATPTPAPTPVCETLCRGGVYFSDFSNHLKIALGQAADEPRCSEDDSAISLLDSEAYCTPRPRPTCTGGMLS